MAGHAKGEAGSGPPVASSIAALSRTLRLTTWSTPIPIARPGSSGPPGLRSRVVLRPKRPQHAAGMRIDPRPSLAWATGTIPAAVAAAAPPLDPPAMCSGFQGLRQGPRWADSVVPVMPNSGVLVLPRITSPAAR